MYQVIKKLENGSRYFNYDENYFYYFNSEALKILDKETFSIVWSEDFKDVEWIEITTKYIVISGRKDQKNKYYFFDKISKEEIRKNFPYQILGFLGCIEDKLLFEAYTGNSFSKRIIGAWDYQNENILWEKESSVYYTIEKGKMLGSPLSSTSIQEILPQDGSLKWDIIGDVLEGRIMPKILKVSDEILIAVFDGIIIRMININTKEILNEWREIPKEYEWLSSKYSEIPGIERAEYIYGNNKISLMHQYFYSEINLNLNEIKCYDLTEEFNEKEIRTVNSGAFSYSGNHIFFFSDFYKEIEDGKYEHIYKMVALNHKTRKLDWTYDMNFPDGVRFQQTEPIVDGDYIYVLDSQKQLYIFRKNEMEK